MGNQAVLYGLYVITLFGVLLSFFICYKKQTVSSYTFCGTTLTLFVVSILATVPISNKIRTPGMSIEPRILNIEKDQKELKMVVTSLAGLIANLYSTTWAKEPLDPKIMTEVEKHIAAISNYLSAESKKKLNQSLESRPAIYTSGGEPPEKKLKKGDLWFSTKGEDN